MPPWRRAHTIRRFVLHGALCIVLHGALCCVALCVAWRFVPRGASEAVLSGPPYVALFRVHPVYHKFSFWATGLVYQKVGIVTMI